MDTSGLLQGIGLFVCVGAIVLIALVAFAARALMGRRSANQNMWNTPGDERPRYDAPDIETRGGFGGVPSTGAPVDRDNDPFDNRDSAFGSGQSGFGGGQSNLNPPTGSARTSRPQRGDRIPRDDDDVRSSGGFGG